MRIGLVLCAVMLCACGRESISWWETAVSGERLFVLSKATGAVYTVQEGELRPIRVDPNEIWRDPASAESEARLNKIIEDDRVIGDLVNVSTFARYRDGRFQVRGRVYPFVDALRDNRDRIVLTIIFLDRSGFDLARVPLRSADLTAVVVGHREIAYAFQSSSTISASEWQDVHSVEVSWTQYTEDAVIEWSKEYPEEAKKIREAAAAERDAAEADSLDGDRASKSADAQQGAIDVDAGRE